MKQIFQTTFDSCPSDIAVISRPQVGHEDDSLSLFGSSRQEVDPLLSALLLSK
jgi:hypothetical protein